MQQKPICVDDYGEEWYKCTFTDKFIKSSNTKKIGSIMPNVKIIQYMENSHEVELLYKQSVRDFHDSEKNCNTCKNLKRINHEKNTSGILQGKCMKLPLYNLIRFHPEDPMHMCCYESRYKNERN